MAKMTFIIRLEDADGIPVDFERWAFKKAETCIDHMVDLYKSHPGLYVPNLNKAARVVCYPTPDGYNRSAPVWSVSAEEFRAMIKEEE